MWKKVIGCAIVFCVGAAGYAMLELLWRGFTHWTMALCGGVCLLCLVGIDNRFKTMNVLKKSAAGCLVITAVEFATGCIVNLWLGLGIWDYSKTPGNVLGQICLPFMLIWLVLCIAVFLILKSIRSFRIKRPQEGSII